MENKNQRLFYFTGTLIRLQITLQIILTISGSVIWRLLQLESAPLELVVTVEDIVLVVEDSLRRTEEPDWNLEEADRNQLEEVGCNLLEEDDRIHLEKAGCSSPAEEHVLVASSSFGLRRFVAVAVGRRRPQHWVYDSGSTGNKRSSSRIRWKWWLQKK